VKWGFGRCNPITLEGLNVDLGNSGNFRGNDFWCRPQYNNGIFQWKALSGINDAKDFQMAVGAATVNGLLIEDWLKTLTKEFQQTSLEGIAKGLNERIQQQRSKDEGVNQAEPMIVHIGGFEKVDGFWLPYVWFIRNTHGFGQFGYLDFRKDYSCSEEFWTYFPSSKAFKGSSKTVQPLLVSSRHGSFYLQCP
jgi:hypothetical protein